MLASLVYARLAEPSWLQPPASRPPPLGCPHPTMELVLGGDTLLDLSFLTDEERRAIAEVLRRDWQLRRREEGRIR